MGASVALTLGTFDPVHADHVRLFRRAERVADELVVGVNSDRFVRQYRGAAATFTQGERLEQVRACGYKAILNDGPGRGAIVECRPAWLVIGSDWLGRDYLSQIDVTADWLEEREIALVYLPRGTTISSTEIRGRMRRA